MKDNAEAQSYQRYAESLERGTNKVSTYKGALRFSL
jgi:hypothetical protein